MKFWEPIKNLFNSIREDLRTMEPVMHQDIVDILNDKELKKKYLKRVNTGNGSGIVDVSDIVEELHAKNNN
jgi:hypothetical protein